MKNKKLMLVGVLLVSLIIDQVSKFIITSQMHVYDKVTLIPEFFSITYVQNTGAAWSMLEGKMIFFYVISVVALVLLLLYLRSLKEYQWMSMVGIMLMISGTIGNFIDRLLLGYVRDFLDFIILGYDFPVFNVADMCLCIGIALVLIDEFRNEYGVGIKWKKKDTK